MGWSLPVEPAQSAPLCQRRFLRGKTGEQLNGAPGTQLFSQSYSSYHSRREQRVSLGQSLSSRDSTQVTGEQGHSPNPTPSPELFLPCAGSMVATQ